MACSCIRSNEKVLAGNHYMKQDAMLSSRNKTNCQEIVSRITVEITKKDNETLGLTVSGGADRGETPVIANIRPGSIAEKSDLFMTGDHIISINGISTSSLCHQEIVNLVKSSKPTITLIMECELPEKVETFKDLKMKQTTISLSKPPGDEGYGIVIRGGFCKDPSKIRPLTVKYVRQGSIADRDGRIKSSDRIVSIRNYKVDHLTPENVMALFAEHRDQLILSIEYNIASVDMSLVSGRPIIVEIQKQVNERLGVSIATYHDNGTDSQIFYIENIEPGSVADRCGVLQVGQVITAIQDLRTDKMSINDAIEALKSGEMEKIKLRIIPRLNFDQIKWHNSADKVAPQIYDRDMSTDKSSKELLSLTDDVNINNSNTDSLVGSDPLDLQCNCSDKYGTSNSLRNLHFNTIADFMTRPKSVLGLESDNAAFSQTLPKKDFRNESLSKSATSLFSEIKSTKKLSLKSENTVPMDSCHLEESQFVLTIDAHGTFGFTIKAHCSHPGEILTQCPQIDHIQKDRPAYACGVLVEGDYIKAIDGVATIGRSLDQINNQLIEATKVNICSLYEVKEPDSQLLVANTIFEIILKKQGGSLGINLQALVTRTVGEPLLISKVFPGSAAYRCGCICAGDFLLALDNKMIDKCTLAEAVHLLQNLSDSLTLRIKKGSGSKKLSLSASQSDFGVFTVDLKRELPCLPWGIVISGTDDSSDQPILIDSINPSSEATGVHRLSSGDQMLSINGHNLRGCTLTQAMKMLHQFPDHVRITVLRQKPDCLLRDSDKLSPANSTDCSTLSEQQKYKLNTKSLGRGEFWTRSGNKSVDSDSVLLNSMTIPSLNFTENIISSDCNSKSPYSLKMNNENPDHLWNINAKSPLIDPVSIITNPSLTTTTESDSSDSQNTSHSLFTKNRPTSRSNIRKEINHSVQNPQQISVDSNGSLTSTGNIEKSIFLKNSSRKEFSICEETTVIEGSEGDSSHADILDSIQCPGCREAIENEWRSKEQLNDSRSLDRRTVRVHGGAVPMSVHPPVSIRSHTDINRHSQIHSNDVQKSGSLTSNRICSMKEMQPLSNQSSQKGCQQLAAVRLCRQSPTESFGIGVSEGLSPKGTFISAIKPNSPASKCDNLQLYDEIVQVNGLSTENMRCSDVVTLISQSENKLELIVRKRKQVIAANAEPYSQPTAVNKPSQTRKLERRASSLRRAQRDSSFNKAMHESSKSINNSLLMKSSSFKT